MDLNQLLAAFQTASAEVKAQHANHTAELAALKGEGKSLQDAQAALKASTEKLAADMKKVDDLLIAIQRKQSEAPVVATVERKSMGQLAVAGFDLKAVASSLRGEVRLEKKDITSLSASAGALVRPDRDPTVYTEPNRRMRIRDLIPSVPVTSGSVEVMRQTTRATNAGPQQGLSNSSTAQGAGEFKAKRESNAVFSLETYPIRTIAHWVPASRQVLADAPQLRSIIDIDLNYGLQLESDDQLLNGDGTGQNLTGLMVDSDVPDIGGLPSGTDTDYLGAAMIDHIRSAITECQTSEYYNINAIIMNPVDWAVIETAKATDGHYLMVAMPSTTSEERVWRVPVIITNAMTASSFILGDFTLGARLYDREDVTVRISESHEDFFVKNGVAILGEERYTMAIVRPLAFAKGSFEVEAT
jgi:HK97 family phage major capsid protein